MDATTLSMAPACISLCVKAMPGDPLSPPSGHAMAIAFCSSVPISSLDLEDIWESVRRQRGRQESSQRGGRNQSELYSALAGLMISRF